MNILVVGNGGREHALVWKLSKSKKSGLIFTAPGNAGTAQISQNVNINSADIESLGVFAKEKHIDLAVIGPEAPLSQGIVDRFQSLGIPAFGPAKGAAEIEASKVFSKYLMQKYNIPCAKY